MNHDVSTEIALDVSAVTVTVALLIAVAAGVVSPARVLLALAFVTFVPGWALLGRFPLAEGASKVALAVPLSLAIAGGSATVLVLLDAWAPLVLLYALAAPSLVLIVWHASTLLVSARTVGRPT